MAKAVQHIFGIEAGGFLRKNGFCYTIPNTFLLLENGYCFAPTWQVKAIQKIQFCPKILAAPHQFKKWQDFTYNNMIGGNTRTQALQNLLDVLQSNDSSGLDLEGLEL